MQSALLPPVHKNKARIQLAKFYEDYDQQLDDLIANKGDFSAATHQVLKQKIQARLLQHFSNTSYQYLFVIWDAIHQITDRELSTMTVGASKNFGLSEADFKIMVAGLQQGEERLFERIFLAQFEACMQYVITHDKANKQDAYDAVMTALLEMRKGLIAEKILYGNLRYLLTKMARQFYYKMQRPQERQLSLKEVPEILEEELEFSEDEFQILEKCWHDLDSDSQDLLQHIYYNRNSIKSLADSMGKSPATLRKRKQRCIAQLKSLFLKYTK